LALKISKPFELRVKKVSDIDTHTHTHTLSLLLNLFDEKYSKNSNILKYK